MSANNCCKLKFCNIPKYSSHTKYIENSKILSKAWISISLISVIKYYVQTTNNFSLYFNPVSPQLVSVVQLERTLRLSSVLDFSIQVRLIGQNHLHFMTGGGDGDFVDLGKALADIHKCFIFSFREDKIKVDGSQDADHHKHQEGKSLQLLLHKQKTHRQELDRSHSPMSTYSLRFLRELWKSNENVNFKSKLN